MGHRAKHRRQALAERVHRGRKIKSDLTPAGLIAWEEEAEQQRRITEKIKTARARLRDLRKATDK